MNAHERATIGLVRAHRLIPGGAHTYSKDDDHFPPNAPAFISFGIGAYAYPEDSGPLLDWGMGLRSVILGHAYPRVVDAAARVLRYGANHTRPTLLEGELAEQMVHHIPGAEMVKFGKNGSDAVTAAVRLARAYTGRLPIVTVATRGSFHASDDWWLSTQTRSLGTFEQGTRLVEYNDVNALETALEENSVHGVNTAAVVMEPMAFEWPRENYLEAVYYLTAKYGALLVFDEIITGFRFGMGGAAGFFGITPDLSCFGKGMANGFSVSALCGRREIMSTPGVHLLSSTHGGETHALAAAIATIDELDEKNVSSHLAMIGERLRAGMTALGYDVRGHPASPAVVFANESERMSFMEKMCRQRILAPYWAPSYSHSIEDADRTIQAAREALV